MGRWSEPSSLVVLAALDEDGQVVGTELIGRFPREPVNVGRIYKREVESTHTCTIPLVVFVIGQFIGSPVCRTGILHAIYILCAM